MRLALRVMPDRLIQALARIWPATVWTPAELGIERIYQGRLGEYLVAVEWQAQTTTLVLARVYDQQETSVVSVIGLSAGMSVESIRRAYLEAVTAWMQLQAPPPPLSAATKRDLAEDATMFETYSPKVSDV